MRVCLINPPQTALWNPLSYPPLGLLYIAARLEDEGFKVVLHNEPHRTLEDQQDEIPEADIYGISATTVCLPVTRKLVSFLRQRRPAAIVVGGVHATVDPKETLTYTEADYVVDGEGEFAFPKLCRELPAEKIVVADRIYNLDALPMPARHLVDRDVLRDTSGIHIGEDRTKKEHVTSALGRTGEDEAATTIISSRGCPYRCHFCSKTRVTDGVRYRSPANIMLELEYTRNRYAIRQFRIVDDSFTIDRYRVADLMEMTAGKGFGFTTLLRADSIHDKQMLEQMKAGGVHTCSFGVESGSQQILKNVNKRETIAEIMQAIRWCKEVGITTKVFLVFGLPGETLATIEETKHFMRQVRPDSFTLSSFQPLPGSAIYEAPAAFGLEPLYKKGEYEDYWFYYEPDDCKHGFHFKMAPEIRRARGDLIRWLRDGKWKTGCHS